MSKTTDLLGTVGVVNDHGFFNRQGLVWIDYTPADNGRGGHGGYATVFGQGVKTNPGGHWQDYGRKTFRMRDNPVGVTLKAYRVGLAQVWATERYGVKEWARTPFGGYGDAVFVRARLKELRALAKRSEGGRDDRHE